MIHFSEKSWDLNFVNLFFKCGNYNENVIRPFVVGRKNWPLSGCPKGASASAGFYSLIQSAKLAGFYPYIYLRDLFKSWEREPRKLSQRIFINLRRHVFN